ncbi:transporter substrate-binding domain-containing protein [Naumannella sp. ID2617S]|uniref:Solute-binding protein family 3/N-terminal domain-containing protein n=1 Tax=Enemella dayhoffiae TaxID=2016507 RepID=A0A255GWR6_9ACTN|nr:transporter substrate-binding domain-containing protein [Enemella dayhoffiae]NNG18845.1 transporter substrate-binding domain-containing protein [Naumannella sp. ID2617S]OYO19396.1 hypothetical protein CGZ93_13640 [Enemella dayhoffiae]
MRRLLPRRVTGLLLAVGLLLTGCSASYRPTPLPSDPPGPRTPGSPPRPCTDPLRSYDPMPLPPAGSVPTNSSMGRVADRGRMIVGVSSDTLSMASREAGTGEITGFEIDLARAIAEVILGPGGKIEFRVVGPAEAQQQVETGELDLVIDQIGLSCTTWARAALSAPYLKTELRAITRPSVQFNPNTLGSTPTCVPAGTHSQELIRAKVPNPVLGRTWSDCLMRFQRGEVDVVVAPLPIAGGLARQDPYAKVSDAGLGEIQFAVMAPQRNVDMIRFVNAVLAQRVGSGEWQRSYDRWVRPYGGDGRPPTPTYGRS